MIKSAQSIEKAIDGSNFGITISDGEGFKFLNHSEQNIEIERIEEKYNGNKIISLRVRNTSKSPINIYSFVVSDFLISDERPVQIMENNWLQCSEVSYKGLDYHTKRNKGFLQRDQNPYSFLDKYGYVKGSIISEWFTTIRFNNKSLFIGAVTTANQFSQIYIKNGKSNLSIRVTCQYDGLILNPGQVIKSEKIFFKVGEEEGIQKDFAKSLAHYMNVKKVSSPISAMCCSYYWNGNKITDEIVNKELDAIQSLPTKLNLDYIQFDAGYTKYFGDWLDYEERFPDGFVGILSKIKQMGYSAGIWLSPFSINPGTKLHDHHKSWLLHDGYKKHFEGRWTSPFDTLSDYIDLEVLDPTNDEVKKYLKEVLLHFKDLGFTLFKLDFMYPVCLSNSYSKPVTRAQALREGMEYIREILGDECLILSGITQLSSVVGIADYVRTGIDTMNPFVKSLPGLKSWVNNLMLENNIKESNLRLFLNGVVWRADPDCLVFTNNTGLDENLIKKHKQFALENNMSLWIGDSVSQMDDQNSRKMIDFINNKK